MFEAIIVRKNNSDRLGSSVQEDLPLVFLFLPFIFFLGGKQKCLLFKSR